MEKHISETLEQRSEEQEASTETADTTQGEATTETETETKSEEATEHTPEEQREYIVKLRDEAKTYRTKNSDLSKRLEEIESAHKAEIESLTVRINEYEQAGNKAKLDSLKAKYNVSDEDADFFFGDDFTKNEEVAKRLSEKAKSTTNVVPSEGQTTDAPIDETRAFVRQIFKPKS